VAATARIRKERENRCREGRLRSSPNPRFRVASKRAAAAPGPSCRAGIHARFSPVWHNCRNKRYYSSTCRSGRNPVNECNSGFSPATHLLALTRPSLWHRLCLCRGATQGFFSGSHDFSLSCWPHFVLHCQMLIASGFSSSKPSFVCNVKSLKSFLHKCFFKVFLQVCHSSSE
jgi:hypothetical protein